MHDTKLVSDEHWGTKWDSHPTRGEGQGARVRRW